MSHQKRKCHFLNIYQGIQSFVYNLMVMADTTAHAHKYILPEAIFILGQVEKVVAEGKKP